MTIIELPRVLSVHGWPAAGISPGRVRSELRRGQWRRLHRGYVLTRPEEPDRTDWAVVGLAVAGSGSALSGWDALRLRGLGDRGRPPARILVLAPRGGNRLIGPVRVRGTTRPFASWRTSALDPKLPGIRVAAVPRAISDLALDGVRGAQLRAVVTSAVQRDLCTPDQLVAELCASARHGRRAFRRAIGDVLDGARSVAEARAVDRLRRAPVPAFELNVSITLASGTLIAVVDVLWRELRAVLEIDSREYHYSEQEWKDTMRRHNVLTRHGLALTHYPPSVINDPSAGWIAEITAWLRERAREVGVPYVPGRGPIRGGKPFVLP